MLTVSINSVVIDQLLMATRLIYPLDQLKDSLKKNGQIWPLLVVDHHIDTGLTNYELVDGVKRWVAMYQMNFKTVEVQICTMTRPAIEEFHMLNSHNQVPAQPHKLRHVYENVFKGYTLLETAQKIGPAMNVRKILQILISRGD
jgi:ParB-like chromosome segregation protein Spo0J